MLTPQHSHINELRKQITSEPVTTPPSLSGKKIPEYFQASDKYETMMVGNKFAPYKVANISDYDCYVLAGIEENELFSKLIMSNMNIPYGLAFDANIHKISQYFPDDIRIINKRVSFLNDEHNENLSDMGGNKDVFLKMNIYGNEYLWVLALSKESLFKFKQMVIVFHDINNNPTQQRALNKIKCFQKIKKTHDVVNVAPVGNNLIVTYFRKDSIEDEESVELENKIDDEKVHSTNIQADVSESDKDLEISKLRTTLKDTVKEVVKNVEKEIITAVSSNLKTEFDNEIEKILEKFQLNQKNKIVNEVDKVDFSQQIEQTQERVKNLKKDMGLYPGSSKLKSEKKENQEDKPIETTEVSESLETESICEEEKTEVIEDIKQKQEAFNFLKPTFSPAPKPFSPETEKVKGRNAKKNIKKQAKKTVVLEDVKEDSAEDKSSRSISPSSDKAIAQEFNDDEKLEDIIDDENNTEEKDNTEEVALVVEED